MELGLEVVAGVFGKRDSGGVSGMMEFGVVGCTVAFDGPESSWDWWCSDGNDSSSLWRSSGVEASIVFEKEALIWFFHCDCGCGNLRKLAATVSEIVRPESDGDLIERSGDSE